MESTHPSKFVSPRLFPGYYVFPCCTTNCCQQDEARNRPKPSFSIDAILGNTSDKARELSPVSLSPSSLSSHVNMSPTHRVHPYPTFNAALEMARNAALDRNAADARVIRRSWKAEKPKRVRTIFSPDQLDRLEKEFDNQQYIVGTERFYLASELGLSETQVKVWFQNRRIKWRKQHLDSTKKTKSDNTSDEEC